MRSPGRVVFTGFAVIAGPILFMGLFAGTASAAPAPAIAKSTGVQCVPSSDVASPGACVVLARGSMGGGGHASGHRGSRHGAANPSGQRGFGGAAMVAKNNRIARRNFATDGNVTNGPNVTSGRDINDRRAVVTNDGRVSSDRRAAVVTDDGRVIVLSDRRAAAVNGMSGVLIRLHED